MTIAVSDSAPRTTHGFDFTKLVLYGFALALCLLIVLPMSWLVYYAFTDKNGAFRLEMPQIIPIFGQPHGHLAYDSGEFKTVFLRPVMRSAKETSLEAHFVLQPA